MNNVSERPHFDVTAGLIFRSGKVLISRRQKGTHLAGMWEFPGGKRETGESLEECLQRELAEELGIQIRVENHCLTVDHSYGDRCISLHVFHCTVLEGDPKPLQSDGIKWVSPRALGSRDFPPPDSKVIAYLQRHNKEDRMFYKKEYGGYRTLAEGIEMKPLTHGEKTLLCEFRLAKGASLPAHAHPHEQAGYLVTGKMRFIIDRKEYEAEPGDSWCIKGDVTHSAEVLEDSVVVEVFSPLRTEYLK